MLSEVEASSQILIRNRFCQVEMIHRFPDFSRQTASHFESEKSVICGLLMEFEKNTLALRRRSDAAHRRDRAGRNRHGQSLSSRKDGSTIVRRRTVPSVCLARFRRCRSRHRSGKTRGRSEIRLAHHSVDSWKELIALRNGLKKAGRSFFALSDPVQHYLTHTGRTLFKELPFEELRRLQLEVLSPSGGEAISRKLCRITSRASRSRITPAGKN